MKLARMITSAALCGATLLAASATGETVTKKVLLLNGNPGAALTTGQKILPTSGGSFTVALWLKIVPSKCANRTDDTIFFQATARASVGLRYDKTNAKLRFVRFSAYSDAYGATQNVAIDAPTDEAWHFVAAVYDKTAQELRLYLDDVCTVTTGCKDTITPSTGNFQMGNYIHNSGDRYFGGGFAEYSVWNSALSTEKLSALHWARPSGDDLEGCIAYWPFDENNGGTTARDLSANNYAVTIPTKQSGGVPIYNLTSVDDFPAGFNEGDTRIFIDVDIVYPESEVQVDVTDATMKDGKYLQGSTATFTASAIKAGLVFDRWWGNVPDELVFDESITLTIDDSKRIAPLYRDTTWVYDNKILTDGYWKLNASISGDEVTVSSVKDYIPMASLDFSKPMVDAEGNPCKAVSFSGQVFFGYTSLRDVKLPNSLRYIGCYENQYNINGCFDGCTAITNIAPLLPPTITYLAPEAFADCWSIRGDLVLGGGAADLDCRPSPSWGRGSQFYNTAIDSLTLLKGFRTVSPSMFSTCFNLKRVEIAKGSVTNILSSGFNKCTRVTEFVMPERPELIEATAFNGWTSNQCRFVVHAADPGWAAYMADAANFISWDALDANTRAGYKTKFVGQTKPLGLSLANPKNQWLCNDSNGGMKILFR